MPFALAFQDAYHSCLADARPHLKAKIDQGLGHNVGRARLLKAQLWVAVKITPGFDQVFAFLKLVTPLLHNYAF